MELLHYFSAEPPDLWVSNFNENSILFVFDGLDECRLPLAFKKNKSWSSVAEPTSVDVLLTNLIKRNMLPSEVS